MPEQATKEEIERAVRSCCAPMTMIYEPHTVEYSAVCDTGIYGTPQRFTMVEGQTGEGQLAYVVSPDRLAEVINSMRFQRPTQDESINALRDPAMRLRGELTRTIDNSWEREQWARDRVACIDAFVAGLELRVPSSLEADFTRLAERISKEADPKWSEYQRLHAKFEGERP